MNLQQEQNEVVIQAYEAGMVTINASEYATGVLLTATEIVHPWGPDSVETLSETHLAHLIETDSDVMILGTGEKQAFLTRELMAFLAKQGLVIEVMTTQAACRTFNVIVSEGRSVVAGLL